MPSDNFLTLNLVVKSQLIFTFHVNMFIFYKLHARIRNITKWISCMNMYRCSQLYWIVTIAK